MKNNSIDLQEISKKNNLQKMSIIEKPFPLKVHSSTLTNQDHKINY